MEPEILPDGDHDLKRCQYISEKVNALKLLWLTQSTNQYISLHNGIQMFLVLLGPSCSVQGSVRPPCVPGRDPAEAQHGHSRTLLPQQIQQRGNRHGYRHCPAPHRASCRHRSETERHEKLPLISCTRWLSKIYNSKNTYIYIPSLFIDLKDLIVPWKQI